MAHTAVSLDPPQGGTFASISRGLTARHLCNVFLRSGRVMKVLVAVSSKHGATREIATAIADHLSSAGHLVMSVDADAETGDLDRFDAFVIGSAIYMGHWTKEARHFIDEQKSQLTAKPVWLFSSGPLGDVSDPVKPDSQVEELIALLGPRGHSVFGGALDKADLSLVERATVRAVHAKYGDYRQWDEIGAWADEIGETLNLISTNTMPSIE